MAAIVKELEVTVTVEDAATVRDALLVTVQFSYLHHGGGSNGVTRQFIAATERRFGKVSFTGMIELEVFRALHRSVIND